MRGDDPAANLDFQHDKPAVRRQTFFRSENHLVAISVSQRSQFWIKNFTIGIVLCLMHV
jgi:hypothetical protein